jgi:hypothetical protein
LRCLNPFGSEELLQSHTEYCSNKEAVRIELPKKGTILKFKNHTWDQRVPFVVYADFESFTEKISGPRQDIEKGSFTHQYQKHSPSGLCYFIKSSIPGVHHKPVLYSKQTEDEDVSEMFVLTLENAIKSIYQQYKQDAVKKEALYLWIRNRERSGITVISQVNIEDLLTASATFSTRLQNSFQSSYTTYQVKMPIYSLRIWESLKATLTVFPTMRRSTFPSPNRLRLAVMKRIVKRNQSTEISDSLVVLSSWLPV